MVLTAMSEISVWCICLNHTEREQRSTQKKSTIAHIRGSFEVDTDP